MLTRTLHASLAIALLLLTWSPTRGDVVPLHVEGGRCEWVQPARQEPCFLVLGSLAGPGRRCRIALDAQPTTAPALLPREPVRTVPREWLEMHTRVERLRRFRQPCETYAPLPQPPRTKTFALFVAEGDLENAAGYAQVQAELRAVGKHVQVYLDARDPTHPDLDAAVADIVRTFDGEVYPWSRARLGHVADVDRDGRFTILLSSRLQRLQGGKVALDGFVRGSDFLRDVAPPFGNRCDMLYLNAHLKAGPQLRTVLAHEFTHAVTFSEHVVANPPGCRQDEESWLSEGLAHLVEDLHQHGWSNLDYRLSAYLAQPERYPLVVSDYFGSGLWRTPGTRGSVYLFLRWCQSHRGPELPARLIQSPLVGIRNVEDATGQPFADLFRGWGVSLVHEESWHVEKPLPDHLPRPQLPVPTRLPCGPTFTVLHTRADLSLAGTALRFVLLPPSDRNRRIRLQADRDDSVQATLVTAEHGLLQLTAQRAGETALTIDVAAHGRAIRLDSVLWEKLQVHEEGQEDIRTRAFASRPQLQPGESKAYRLVDFLPRGYGHEMVVKVVGEDADGQRVTGLAYVPPPE